MQVNGTKDSFKTGGHSSNAYRTKVARMLKQYCVEADTLRKSGKSFVRDRGLEE